MASGGNGIVGAGGGSPELAPNTGAGGAGGNAFIPGSAGDSSVGEGGASDQSSGGNGSGATGGSPMGGNGGVEKGGGNSSSGGVSANGGNGNPMGGASANGGSGTGGASEPLPPEGADPKLHLFILSGQSNMALIDVPTQFTPHVVAGLPGETAIVVKFAKGGEPIRRWYKGWTGVVPVPEVYGDLYDTLMASVNQAVQGKVPGTVTFVWMQGEADAFQHHSAIYLESLNGLLAQLQADLGRQDVRFVIGRLSDHTTFSHWTTVRQAQVTFAEASPSRAWVDTDDLNGNNELHFPPEGYAALGQRFAEASLKLIGR